MRSIKVLATNSTNVFLREKLQENPFTENCCVQAITQTQGKGQRGAGWEAEPGKNLTFSVLLTQLDIPVEEQFKLSAITAMAVLKVLKKLNIANLQLKWPNDILADKKKIAGILIENRLEGKNIKNAIIGIGLNVNQENFIWAPRATSVKLLKKSNYNCDVLLQKLVEQLEKDIYKLKNQPIEEILAAYKKHLFKFDTPCTFETNRGEQKTGIIKNVSKQGKLSILFEDGILQEFALKEVKMLY